MPALEDPSLAAGPSQALGIPPPPRAGARAWCGLALLALPTILLGLDLTLLHLALPALALELRPTSTQALWIVDAYGFMVAGFLVTMGALGDRIGRRRLLLAGAAAFGAASVIAAFSSSAAMLIVARGLLGIAGATLMPSTLALISTMFPRPRQRALAIGVWATMFALGMAAGPVVGGVLLQRWWWGAAFLVGLPVTGLLLLAAPFLLPEYRAPRSGPLDLPSVAQSLLAILPVVYGIKQIAKDGAGVAATLSILAGAAFMILFVRRQRRLATPLIDLDLFASRAFTVALLVLLVGLLGVGGTMLLVTQYLQLVAGLSPLAAGLWMGPPALAMLAAGIAAPVLARRVRPGYVISSALGIAVIGYLLLGGLQHGAHGVATATAAFSLVYLGLGTIAALGTDLVVGTAPVDRAGSASALSETVQELGLAIGIALLGSLATAVYRGRMTRYASDRLDEDIAPVATDSLAGAFSIASRLPAGTLEQAQHAFMAGLNSAAAVCALVTAILAGVAAVTLRQAGVDPAA